MFLHLDLLFSVPLIFLENTAILLSLVVTTKLLLACIMSLMDVRLKKYIIMFRSHLGLLTLGQFVCFKQF